MTARARTTLSIISALVDGIYAHGQMPRETINQAGTIAFYFVAATQPALAVHVDPDQLEALASAHPGCRTLPFGGPDWTRARLDAIADGIPGYPGVGEACAAGYFVGEQIECDGIAVDLTPIRETVRDWMRTRGTARRSDA